MRRRAWVQIAAATLSGNSLRQTVHTHRASVHQAVKLVAAHKGNCRPGRKYWQPSAGFMTHVTYRLTAKNRDRLWNPTLGCRVRATITCIVQWHHGASTEAVMRVLGLKESLWTIFKVKFLALKVNSLPLAF